ncbi:hypothetical protein ONZ45_g9207 [Pleurotus djamor]|nr:hypothetical protein ONZ45_g9207 [Pleurotus djamor]
MHHPGFYPAFVPFAPQPYHPQYIMPGRPDAQIAMPSTYAYAPPPPHMYAKPMPPGPSGEIQQPQSQQPIPSRSPQQRHAAEEQPKE